MRVTVVGKSSKSQQNIALMLPAKTTNVKVVENALKYMYKVPKSVKKCKGHARYDQTKTEAAAEGRRSFFVGNVSHDFHSCLRFFNCLRKLSTHF